MKKIFLILLSFTLFSCDNYLDVNTDPNYPSEVPTSLVIPSAQNFIATRLGGNIFNYTGFYAQYWDQAVEANQYNEIAENRIKADFFNNDYRYLYAGALADLDVAIKQSEAAESWGDYFVSTVLRAYTFQILVDLMDKAPYTEALQGSANSMPVWDEGSAIYAGVIAEIDNAMSKLTSTSTISADLMLNRNVDQWIGFANALKLKLYMRSSYAQDNKAQIMALINENNFFKGNVLFASYSNESGKRNPWYETNSIGLGTVNNIASLPIITYLKRTSDPRMSSMFDQSINKSDFIGLVPGGKTEMASGIKTKDFSYPVIGATQPVYFFTQSELYFFISEAQLRFGNNDEAAKAAYEAAIEANFSLRGLSGGSAVYGEGKRAAWTSATTAEGKLELIGLQKWVALCMVNHFEAWSELRRLGYPQVSTLTASAVYADETSYTEGQLIRPWVNQLGTEMIQRLLFPERAVNLNDNTPDQAGLAATIWWDKK
ncbi:MAG: SusD/RagB family nutrient-binding outer membrane lipoprotein [Parabacteroides sp.]|nr:SusD/RagB family nutrient-binding outer membrane lipoprotein [Parabacteroides sp.]